jgi:hypothetical protein
MSLHRLPSAPALLLAAALLGCGAASKGDTVAHVTQSGCDACHGFPPAVPHPVNGACQQCHPARVGMDGLVVPDAAAHQNGRVDLGTPGSGGGASGPPGGCPSPPVAPTCIACHGLPPPAPHAQNANCHACHGTVADVNDELAEGGPHDDGVVDLAPATDGCTAPITPAAQRAGRTTTAP